MDNSRDELDRLIDGALASYSNAEPLAGVEARVLNRVRLAQARQRWMFAWAAGLAVAASVVAGILIRTERRVVPKPVEVLKAANVAPPVPVVNRAVRIRARVRGKRPKALPKLEQFPTPTPLSAEERALAAFVQRDPKEAQQVFAELQKRADEPVEIQPIQIPPLQSNGSQ
jgi:hypothetical protein